MYIACKYFKGDGANLGLHEMSHALYFQKFVIEENFAHDFCRKYNCVITECHAAFKTEVDRTKNLYSDYATTDMQEFWAESVEIFFEKTNELKANYPQVFDALMLALNQNPLNKTYPLVKTNLYLARRLKRF